MPDLPASTDLHQTTTQDHGLVKALDNQLIELCRDALDNGEPVRARLPIRNVNRTVGTMLGHEVTKRYRGAGLPDGTIDLTFVGSAGQSFGAFVPHGVTLRLEGDANDYLAKGLSGGRVVVRPDRSAPFKAEENIVAGNVIAYGATGGELFVRGVVGERFCVRNSGVVAVVEGVGDHACEYMTGGRVVVLGQTGRNIAAGMSGGIAYILDLDSAKVNTEMVELTDLDDDGAAFVEAQLRAHLEHTDSTVAADLLAQWQDDPASARQRFTTVMPLDYKRVLEAEATARAEGRDVLEAIMEAARG
jgi:glutamate synthase (NADPH/NADH) large chain